MRFYVLVIRKIIIILCYIILRSQRMRLGQIGLYVFVVDPSEVRVFKKTYKIQYGEIKYGALKLVGYCALRSVMKCWYPVYRTPVPISLVKTIKLRYFDNLRSGQNLTFVTPTKAWFVMCR